MRHHHSIGALRSAIYDWHASATLGTARALTGAFEALRGAPEAAEYLTQSLHPEHAAAVLLAPGAENDIRARVAWLESKPRMRLLYESKGAQNMSPDHIARCVATILGYEPGRWTRIGWLQEFGYPGLALVGDSRALGADLVLELTAIRPGGRERILRARDIETLREDNARLWGWIGAECHKNVAGMDPKVRTILTDYLDAVPWSTIQVKRRESSMAEQNQ